MKTKRYKKSRFMKYAARTFFLILLAGAAFLITIGCLYLRDQFKSVEAAATTDTIQVAIKEDEVLETVVEVEPKPVVTAPPTGMCVVLDAGHGGNDGGTYYQDVIEKDINLDVVMCLKDILEENDVEVILTRDTDVYLSLEERTVIANKTDADLFVSIHCNYYEDDAAVDGIDCYYCPNAEDEKQCAEAVIAALRETGKLEIRGAKAEEFYVTENTDMTAILIEIGFLSNPTDRRNLTNADYQQMLSDALAKGILTNLEETGAANN